VLVDASDMKRSPPENIDRVDVCAAREQRLDSRQMARISSEDECRFSSCHCCVNSSSSSQKRAHAADSPFPACVVQASGLRSSSALSSAQSACKLLPGAAAKAAGAACVAQLAHSVCTCPSPAPRQRVAHKHWCDVSQRSCRDQSADGEAGRCSHRN